MKLQDKIAIVTGGGQGIGRCSALQLAREGARVVIADIDEGKGLETADLIHQQLGRKVRTVAADMAVEEQVAALVKSTLELDNRIDILVNNAGIVGPVEDVENIDIDDWNRTLAVNITGMFLGCKHVVPAMKQNQQGVIVNMGSVAGKRGMPQRTAYSASKMAVIGFTRTLAAEVGKWGIRVNALCPGTITGARQDRVNQGIMKYTGKTLEQVVAAKIEASALKTMIAPEYVAGLVAFLCSGEAAMMTGQDINISAGAVMY